MQNKGQKSPAAAAGADDPGDGDGDQDLEDDVCLDIVEYVGAKFCLRETQDRCRDKKRNVPETVAKALQLDTESVNQEASADTGSSNDMVSEKDCLGSALDEAKKAKYQLGQLSQTHDTVEGDLSNSSNKVQDNCIEMVKAWRDKAVSSENSLHKIWSTESEKTKKFLRERDVASASLHKRYRS